MSDALKPQLHGRDHRPGGRDPIPLTLTATFPWVRIGQMSRTCTNAVQTRLPFRFLEYDSTITNVSVTDFSWTEQNMGLAHNVWEVSTRREGFYFFDLQVTTAIGGTIANDAGKITIGLTTDAANELSELSDARMVFDSGTFTSGEQGDGALRVRFSGVVYIASTNRTWKPWVTQETGGNLDVGSEYLYIVKLQETDGTAWTTLTST